MTSYATAIVATTIVVVASKTTVVAISAAVAVAVVIAVLIAQVFDASAAPAHARLGSDLRARPRARHVVGVHDESYRAQKHVPLVDLARAWVKGASDGSGGARSSCCRWDGVTHRASGLMVEATLVDAC